MWARRSSIAFGARARRLVFDIAVVAKPDAISAPSPDGETPEYVEPPAQQCNNASVDASKEPLSAEVLEMIASLYDEPATTPTEAFDGLLSDALKPSMLGDALEQVCADVEQGKEDAQANKEQADTSGGDLPPSLKEWKEARFYCNVTLPSMGRVEGGLFAP